MKTAQRLFPNYLTGFLVLLGVGLLIYPQAAAWFAQLNQTELTVEYNKAIENAVPNAREQLVAARAYNDALTTGTLIPANERLPRLAGESSDTVEVNGRTWTYEELLSTRGSPIMARLRIPKIDVDLPVYHGTSDETLLKGAGHLEGTALPVGGASTRSVITAHRGLAEATMFTNLDKVEPGDRFTVEVFGEVLTYEVRDVVVVEPEETEHLSVEAGRDLVTLVTCTPLGINSHRILVTGERVVPTPAEDLAKAGAKSDLPRFPFWAVIGSVTLLLVTVALGHRTYREIQSNKARRANCYGADKAWISEELRIFKISCDPASKS